jgi:membrane protein DedA with SNARE-associated domain
MDAFVDFILAQDPTLVVILLMVVSALENVFPPVPADVAAALGTFWAVRTGHSAVAIGLLCFLANQASAIGVYLFARARGEAVLKSRIMCALMPDDVQAMVGRNIDRFGGLGVFVSRFLPLSRTHSDSRRGRLVSLVRRPHDRRVGARACL